ncbi:MAG: cysteine methyltransferase, partial [Micromonosporaceae bacterium]|nr:cysteine methyltransferase [Micromonosporaceae bacterium]
MRISLPEPSEAHVRERISRHLPLASEAPPPPAVARAIDLIVALLHGVPADLRGIRLNPRGIPAFRQRVYEAARAVPC